MAIPLATTSVTILRPDPSADTYDSDAGPATIATGVRANIGTPRGSGSEVGGQVSVTELRLTCDLADLQDSDVVVDETTNVAYSVVWVMERNGLGVSHLEAGLRIAKGAA